MKRLLKIAIVMLVLGVGSVAAQTGNGREKEISGYLRNAVTGSWITDTIMVEVLNRDSVVVGKTFSELDPRPQYASKDDYQYWFDVRINEPGEDFILRFSHPDYATEYRDIKATGHNTEIGYQEMRKLTRFEKGLMLGEVVVKSSVIQVVNKGDTIQYNADAFAVAQGSMLDALVEQLPGVELKDGGQIFVNGRFVDKLLLDGKDFFKGDQFVLLQNLPAYTVKNIKVYEEASASTEVFGKGKASDDPDLFVMDINLKKGYNNGWIANAEAGGGTHSRYRGRAFGVGYSKAYRLGLFGFMNNLNESRNPGRNGDWSPSDGNAGMTTTKAGGLDYGYFAADRTRELTGSVTATHKKTDRNTLTNTENFLAGGNTYTRRWNDQQSRDLILKTTHRLTLRPKAGNRYRTNIDLSGSYTGSKTISRQTEGTFGRSIADEGEELRTRLDNGWVEGMDAINRYLEYMESHREEYSVELREFTAFTTPGNSYGFRVIGSGGMRWSDDNGTDINNYLLQYRGEPATERNRSNPTRSHGYNYVVALDWIDALKSAVSLSPRIDYFQRYDYNSNMWLTDAEDGSRVGMLPSMRQETMLRLDPRNSYITGRHTSNLRPRLPIVYIIRKTDKNGMEYTPLMAVLEMEANIRHAQIDFDGIRKSRAVKNYVTPRVRAVLQSTAPGQKWKWQMELNINANEIDPFNLLDVVLDPDPLNIRTGNPDLEWQYTTSISTFWFTQDWLLNHLWLHVMAGGNVQHRAVAMGYAYDRASGVKTYKPVNVDGNRWGYFGISPTVAIDSKKSLQLENSLQMSFQRSVDMVSYDGFATTEQSRVSTVTLNESSSLSYTVDKFMIAGDWWIDTKLAKSGNGYFDPFRITQFRYGVRGRVSLPAGFELSSDLKMYSTRGFDYKEMNTNQLVWNGRITKMLLKGKLMASLDGYDILGNVKNISYRVNEQGRTETWVNGIPSYVMVSLRWNFAKKPRE